MSKRRFNLTDLRLLIQWIGDIESEEIIESRRYNRAYFGFPRLNLISHRELDCLVDHINPILKIFNYKTRIDWRAGEIRPIRDKEDIREVDEFYGKNLPSSFNFVYLVFEEFDNVEELGLDGVFSSRIKAENFIKYMKNLDKENELRNKKVTYSIVNQELDSYEGVDIDVQVKRKFN